MTGTTGHRVYSNDTGERRCDEKSRSGVAVPCFALHNGGYTKLLSFIGSWAMAFTFSARYLRAEGAGPLGFNSSVEV